MNANAGTIHGGNCVDGSRDNERGRGELHDEDVHRFLMRGLALNEQRVDCRVNRSSTHV